MKRILSITSIFAFAFLLLSAFSIRENPQDPPRGKKVEKHIKMVKVNDAGEKVVLDTILENDDVFVWNGDTVKGGKELKWISKDDFKLDSLHQHFDMDFEYEIDDDGEGNVFIMKSGGAAKPMIREFKMHGDSMKKFVIDIDTDKMHGEHDAMIWHSDEGNNEMIFRAPGMPGAPHAPNVMFMGKGKKGNVIDLSDSGIISFKKKKMSGGREKITIIRNEVKEDEVEVHEEIIMNGGKNRALFFDGNGPQKNKAIKVIRSDDGKVEIIEDENVWNVKKGDANVRVIEEDGKIIHIRESKNGNEKQVEVKVEVKEEKEKENN